MKRECAREKNEKPSVRKHRRSSLKYVQIQRIEKKQTLKSNGKSATSKGNAQNYTCEKIEK